MLYSFNLKHWFFFLFCLSICTGQSGLGKSTLMNTLFKSKVSRRSVMTTEEERIPKTIEIKSISHGKKAWWTKTKMDKQKSYFNNSDFLISLVIYSAHSPLQTHFVYRDWGKRSENEADRHRYTRLWRPYKQWELVSISLFINQYWYLLWKHINVYNMDCK